VTYTLDGLRAAAEALGATPAEAVAVSSTGDKITRYEAERALGGTATATRNPFAASDMPPRPRPGQRHLSREGGNSDREIYERQRAWTRWKAHRMAQFRTMAGRRAAVSVLERAISGTAVSVPDGVEEALDMLMESMEPDLPHSKTPLGDPAPIILYEQLQREYERDARRRPRKVQP
jgi:hypothetical protein